MIQGVLDPRSKAYLYLYYRLYKKESFPSVGHLLNVYGRARSEVSFLQIGANEGSTEDPLYPHIRLRNWKGILVEPLAEEFKLLKHNYQNNPGLIFENVAIADREESRTLYTIDKTTGEVPFWVSKLSSFDPSIPQQVKQSFPNAVVIEKQVPCTTIENLLNKHNLGNLQVLVIDAEGYDFEIIKTVNWDNVQPELVIFEHRHLSEADQQSCQQLFRNLGYEIYCADFDTVVFKDEALRKVYLDHLLPS
ncbi:MAG: FkbM family methyltransferase [Bacteroidota bacterium]